MIAYSGGGDAAAFSMLYQRYESRLYGFFVRRLSSQLRSLASDLFQKTWLKVHGARHRFDGTQRFSPWLFSIALNTLRDEWRVPHLVEQFDEPSDLGAKPAPDDVEKSLGLKQDMVRLEIALSKIPDNQREALLLSEWEGFSARELAQILGTSEVAARQMVSRARKKVRLIMMEEEK
jgi:RNA polymerase sigma-70 factor (ECF subfamily)